MPLIQTKMIPTQFGLNVSHLRWCYGKFSIPDKLDFLSQLTGVFLITTPNSYYYARYRDYIYIHFLSVFGARSKGLQMRQPLERSHWEQYGDRTNFTTQQFLYIRDNRRHVIWHHVNASVKFSWDNLIVTEHHLSKCTASPQKLIETKVIQLFIFHFKFSSFTYIFQLHHPQGPYCQSVGWTTKVAIFSVCYARLQNSVK